MIRTFTLATSALALTLLAGTAFAGEENSGYNTSNTDSVTIGTSNITGGEAPGDAQKMQDIQQGAQDLKDRWSGSAQREAVEGR